MKHLILSMVMTLCFIAGQATESIAVGPDTGKIYQYYDMSKRKAVLKKFQSLPLQFIENQGQMNKRIKYYETGAGHSTYFTEDAIYFSLLTNHSPAKTDYIKLTTIGSNSNIEIIAEKKLRGNINYLKGQERSDWKTGIPTYGSILYKEVYDNIDIRFYGNQGKLEYDIIVRPGARPETVRLQYERIKNLYITDSGDLEISLNEGRILQEKPYIYQKIDGLQTEIKGEFKIIGEEMHSETLQKSFILGFQVAAYDTSKALVIDPTIVYSVYPGGEGDDIGYAIAVDNNGYAYITGETWSAGYLISQGTNFPPVQGSIAGSGDAFVTKLSMSGVLTEIVYSTYLGGTDSDLAKSIAVDDNGNAYVTGETTSADFPVASPLQGGPGGGVTDGFVSKLSADGKALLFSTYLGGSNEESGQGIVLDNSGNVYITGGTSSANFVTTSPVYQSGHAGMSDVFVTKFTSTGSLIFSTLIGGAGADFGYGIALGSDNSMLITGETNSADFPEVSSLYSQQGLIDAFVSKLNADGTVLSFSTYIGGSNSDYGYGIAVDGSDSIYITGETLSNDFPTQSPFQQNFAGGLRDAYVLKIDATGSLVYSTYLGGDGDDFGYGIVVDSAGNAYVTGETASTDFPRQLQLFEDQGLNDAFVTKINPDGMTIDYSTYLKGNDDDIGWGIAIDSSGDVYVVGETKSTDVEDFPSAAVSLSASGSTNGFVIKLNDADTGGGNGGSNGGGGSSGGGGGGGCFIATAAYGSYLSNEVVVLRNFRDRWLINNKVGNAFVNLYYDLSPPIADYIAMHSSLRIVTRTLLTPVVFSIKKPFVSMLILLISGVSLIFIYRRNMK